MAKFKFQPLLLDSDAITARVGDGPTTQNPLTLADKGKFVKLVGDSQYGLCAEGNEIEGVLQTFDFPNPADGFTLGGVMRHQVSNVPRRLKVVFGEVLNVGDKVVVGAVAARGTAMPAGVPSGAPPARCRCWPISTTVPACADWPASPSRCCTWRRRLPRGRVIVVQTTCSPR